MQQIDVIVVGGGMAGVACASQLGQAGQSVMLIEKARGSGGRLSSKRIEGAEGECFGYDLGAVSFAASDTHFKRVLSQLQQKGYAQQTPQGEWIGGERNSKLLRGLLEDVETTFGRRVTRVSKCDAGWRVSAEDSADPSDQVTLVAKRLVLAAPPVQAAALVDFDADLSESLAAARLLPQWVVMIASRQSASSPNAERLLEKLNEASEGAFSALSLESHKRQSASGRGSIWQLHYATDWSRRRVDVQPEAVRRHALAIWQECAPDAESIASHVHRWLYSVCGQTSCPNLTGEHQQRVADACYYDAAQHFGLCGDYWLSNGAHNGVESAFLSGFNLAQRMI
ncbi:MAG: FAD-dependent oxidoreductase [Oleiphilaceae bacterium]|nr:FAD-dependent oxidoreductase [Oleiphilaceae bacterium]